MRRLAAGLATAAAIVAVAAGTSATKAACDGPVPRFTEAVDSAPTVIVGTVVAIEPRDTDPPGHASRFTLRVDHVLRGESDPVVTFDGLVQQPCAGALIVPDGAVIALALGGEAFSPPMEVNAPAFIEGRSYLDRPNALTQPERLTLAEVFALVGVPMPSTATTPPMGPAGPNLVLVGAFSSPWPSRTASDGW